MRLIGFYDYTVLLTYMSLFSAVTGITFAAHSRFAIAVFCLFVSGFLDAFDGIVARTKKDRTEDQKNFGIQIDSLVDLIAFGILPAAICYFIGLDGILGMCLEFLLCLCAVIRLAFFNVLETKRQREQGGMNKYYRGLPVTAISIIMPVVYILGRFMPDDMFIIALHIMLAVTAFLFVLDFSVKKPDWLKIIGIKRKNDEIR